MTGLPATCSSPSPNREDRTCTGTLVLLWQSCAEVSSVLYSFSTIDHARARLSAFHMSDCSGLVPFLLVAMFAAQPPVS